jgi:mycobactin lysine-N-oxygenase
MYNRGVEATMQEVAGAEGDMAAMAASDAPRPGEGRTLIVLGAGPKGLAIAAKCAALRGLGFVMPRVVLVDRRGAAANWSGAHGYTDGRRLLGTLPEKDIGFPYDSTCWGDAAANQAVDRAMAAFSWQAYLTEAYRYAEWIDRGRPRPTHRQWAAYLRWVAHRSAAEVLRGEVHDLGLVGDVPGGRWRVRHRSASSRHGERAAAPDGNVTDADGTLEGDGLVVTGPGTPIALPGQPADDPRVLDGSSVWLALDRIAAERPPSAWRGHAKPLRVGIVGTGETAAAVVVALLEALGDSAQIEVLSPRGVLYSRDEGFEENQLFSNPDPHRATELGKRHPAAPDSEEARDELAHTHAIRWLGLTEADRREFVRRADRGVFSVQAVQEMTTAWNVRSVTGNAARIEATPRAVRVEASYAGESAWMEYDYVVIARGFDPTWFLALCDAPTRDRLEATLGAAPEATALERAIGTDLAVAGFLPRLHLPMLAGLAQGPGFPNLSCLGLLADRVLAPYAAPMA